MNEIEPIEDGSGAAPRIVGFGTEVRKPHRFAATFTKNSLMSVGRLFISTAVGFLLPSFLVHRLPVTTYSAWVLILQMSAYVNYLDFGIQSGISKYVAEFEARGDAAGSSVRASAGLILLVIASLLGIVLTLTLAWRVPSLFHEMPPSLYHDVRLGLIYVGCSASVSLLCSIFSAIFMGLQRFGVPTVLALMNRVLFVMAVLGAVCFHSSLATMGAAVAVVNGATGLLYLVAWRRLTTSVTLRLRGLDYVVVRQMLAYCSSLAIWTVGMLCVSGLDVTIVGRYDFRQTAFYSIAATPANFMLAIMGAMLAPLMPTASALSVHRTPQQMGDFLVRITRYTTTLLMISGLPLLVAGYWILRFWLGPAYATPVLGYLRILVLANVLRNSFAPYANLLVATDSQKVAIAGASAEAIVNLTCSVYLARHIGAIGVAYGTLIGSFVSIGMHVGLSMHYTYTKFSARRVSLLLSGVLRPAAIALPSLLLLPLWWSAHAPAFGPVMWAAWGGSTLLLAFFVALSGTERHSVVRLVRTSVTANRTAIGAD
jgi:O-antigen/teichoic acid export membrane protein